MKPALVFAVQWFVLAGLTALAILNAATDHGVLMGVNCICLGFLFCSLLMRKWMDRRMAEMDKLVADLKSAEANANAQATAFGQAINDGRIEVFPVAPDRPPTWH